MEISTFLTILLFPSIAALANCEFETDIEAWDCQTYKQYFQYEQLEDTLLCLDYHKDLNPTQALQRTEPTTVFVNRDLQKVVRISELHMEITLEETFHFAFIDERLKMNCSSEDQELNFFYPTDALALLWTPNFDFADNSASYELKRFGPFWNSFIALNSVRKLIRVVLKSKSLEIHF